MYTLNIVGPDGSTVMTSTLWNSPQASLSDEQRANIQGEFYDLSSEESLNSLSNEIAENVGNHYDNFVSEEAEDTVISETGGPQELQEAGASS